MSTVYVIVYTTYNPDTPRYWYVETVAALTMTAGDETRDLYAQYLGNTRGIVALSQLLFGMNKVYPG